MQAWLLLGLAVNNIHNYALFNNLKR